MLKGELGENRAATEDKPLTYGAYLRVPELLRLQTPLKEPPEHDEMLFVIVQQIQELWFKQMLYELRAIIDAVEGGALTDAARLLTRTNRILKVVANEVAILETMLPQDFQRFRYVLTTSSGFESEQFRELEMASGLSTATFQKLLEKRMDLVAIRAAWPKSLHEAFLELLADVDPDPMAAVVRIYEEYPQRPELFALAEALSEYELLFNEWRFRHVKVVERTIGDRMPGTAGSSGVGYLGKTLGYRFFPELWEARNQITARARP
ncbi:MAG: tryptophan 2,3-dioxygenase [Chloroflexia bacterium]